MKDYFKVDHILKEYYVTSTSELLKLLDVPTTELELQYHIYNFLCLRDFFKYIISMYHATIYYYQTREYHFRVMFKNRDDAMSYCDELNKLYNTKMSSQNEDF